MNAPDTPGSQAASQTERHEAAIVAHLRERLGNDVLVDVQPDDPRAFDMAGAHRVVLVHFLEERPTKRPFFAGATFALICLSRSYRGVGGGQALREAARDAMVDVQLPGLRAFRLVRSRTEGQVGGVWRWVVEVATELPLGAAPAEPARFIEDFETRGTTL